MPRKCGTCDNQLPENNPEWKKLCLDCFLKVIYKKCSICEKNNIKNHIYDTCYTCNMEKKKLKVDNSINQFETK